MTPRRSPWLAALLSLLLPGLGQLYNGERGKGVATLCISLGTWTILFFSLAPGRAGAWLSALLLGFVYLFIWIPAVVDAYRQASGAPNPWLSGRSAWYVIAMLLTVGPMALPLLWQSPAFSRSAKIGWTVAVILIALLVVAIFAVLGPVLEELFGQAGP